METFIIGTCEEMCPENEIKMRTKERLLHFYEKNMNNRNQSNKYLMIKAFARSAAGVKVPTCNDLRTPRALKKTIQYLLKIILTDTRKPFYFVYDFIFDRLRCVRQEIIMQNLNLITTLELLEPMIMFLSYSAFRLCEESYNNYDPKICVQHLQECLKKALCCYDELSVNGDFKTNHLNNRKVIESIYLVLNLGDFEALNRGIMLPKELLEKFPLKNTVRMSLEYWQGNYYKSLQLITQLPDIVCAIAALKIPVLRRQLLQTFSYAYHSKTVPVSIAWLQNILLYNDNRVDQMYNDLRYYNVEIVNNTSVKFDKGQFDKSRSPLTPRRELFVEEKLGNEIETISNLMLLCTTE